MTVMPAQKMSKKHSTTAAASRPASMLSTPAMSTPANPLGTINQNINNQNSMTAGRNGSAGHQSQSTLFGQQFSQKWQQEREEIVRFWLSLADSERRKMLIIDKHDLLQRMKDQSRQTMCHCEACSRRGNFIEDELDQIYDHFYRELSFAYQPISLSQASSSQIAAATNAADKKRPGSAGSTISAGMVASSKEDLEMSAGVVEKIYRLPNASTPPAPFKMGWDDIDEHFDHTLQPMAGGKLTFAEELLSDDYRKFMVMIEHLPVQESVDFDDDDDEGDSDTYVESDDEFSDADYSDQDVIPSDDDDESATSGERLEESRRMFQIFAAKIMEERVVRAYMERQAEDEREKFMRELYEEDERKKQADLKKKQKKASQKEKKRLELQQKEEEKKRREDERRQEEENKRKAEEDRREQQRLEKEKAERERRELEEKQFQEQMEKLRKEKEDKERVEREKLAAEAALNAAAEEALAAAESSKAKKKKSKKKKKSGADSTHGDDEIHEDDEQPLPPIPVAKPQPEKKKPLHPLPQLEKEEVKLQERLKTQELNSHINSNAVGFSSLLSPHASGVPPGIQTGHQNIIRSNAMISPPVGSTSGVMDQRLASSAFSNNVGMMNLFPQQNGGQSRDSPMMNSNPVLEDPVVHPIPSKPVQPIGHRGSLGDNAFSIVNNPMLNSMPPPMTQNRKWASGLVPSFDPFSSRSLFDLDSTEPAQLSMYSGPPSGGSSGHPGQFSMPPPPHSQQSAFHHPSIPQQQQQHAQPPNMPLQPGQQQQQQPPSHFQSQFNSGPYNRQ